jgi:DNA-damage-inducible protein J
MSDNSLVQVRIDPEIRERAAAVFGRSGLTVSDAVRVLLTRTANEGVVPLELQAEDAEYDAWFRTQVQEALDDPRPGIPDEEVRAHFAKRREELRRKIAAGA